MAGDRRKSTSGGESGQASLMRCNLFPCPTPERVEGASQVLGVRYSSQKKEPVKRLFLKLQASHKLGDERRGGSSLICQWHLAMWLTQHAFAFTHTFPSAWNPSLLLTLCHLKSPSSELHSLTLQRKTKLQESIPPYCVPIASSTCHYHTSYHTARNCCGQGPRGRDLALFVCFPAICSGTWLQQTCSKWWVSEWPHQERNK